MQNGLFGFNSSIKQSSLYCTVQIYQDQKKIPEVCIYMDGLLLRANRTIKVSNRVHHPFKSPKCPALAYKRHNGHFDYRLDYVLRHEEHLPTNFQDKEINASIGIIHLFPSIPISQVISAV